MSDETKINLGFIFLCICLFFKFLVIYYFTKILDHEKLKKKTGPSPLKIGEMLDQWALYSLASTSLDLSHVLQTLTL